MGRFDEISAEHVTPAMHGMFGDAAQYTPPGGETAAVSAVIEELESTGDGEEIENPFGAGTARYAWGWLKLSEVAAKPAYRASLALDGTVWRVQKCVKEGGEWKVLLMAEQRGEIE